MFFNSLISASTYPAEVINFSINPLDNPIANARVGVRYRYFYYGDDTKLNFTNTELNINDPIPADAYTRKYILASYSTTNNQLLTAKSPTNFFDPNTFNPITWTVGNENEYLYYNAIAGLYGATVYPTHPYPIINKISNSIITVSAALVSATGFDGEVLVEDFRKYITKNPSLIFYKPNLVVSAVSGCFVSTSTSKKKYSLGKSINSVQTYYNPSIGQRIHENSFKLSVPVLTAKYDANNFQTSYFLEYFVPSNAKARNDTVSTTNQKLSCLYSELLRNIGITYPFTYTGHDYLNPMTGEVNLNFKNLYLDPANNITVSYETQEQFISPDFSDSTLYWSVAHGVYNPGDRVIGVDRGFYECKIAHNAVFTTYRPGSGDVGGVGALSSTMWKVASSFDPITEPWNLDGHSGSGMYQYGDLVTNIGNFYLCINAHYAYYPPYSPGTGSLSMYIWKQVFNRVVNPVISSISGTSLRVFELSSSHADIFLYDYTFLKDNATDAFTISFQPSSTLLNLAYSSVDCKTVMTDNYYQTSFNMTLSSTVYKRFRETNNDFTLSAFNYANSGIYVTNEWMPVNGDIKFYNNGLGNKYQVQMEIQKFGTAIVPDKDFHTFLLCKKNITLEPYITSYNDNSASISSIVFPQSNEGYGVKWTAFPPENIKFYLPNTNTEIIADTLYADLYSVDVKHLGVDKTELTLYSEEYETSASTFWFPSTSVIGQSFLQVAGTVDDNEKIGTVTLSALINKNGLSYRVPTDSDIIWEETAKDSRAKFTMFNSNGGNLEQNSINAASNAQSLVYATVSTVPVISDPKYILFNVACSLYRYDFSLNASKNFLYREFPIQNVLDILAEPAILGQIIDSSDSTHVVLTSTSNINMSAHYPDLVVTDNNLIWNWVGSNHIAYSGVGPTFAVNFSSVSACVTLVAKAARPFDGNFGKYIFTKTMCFFNISAMGVFDYIAFPENRYAPIEVASDFIPDFNSCSKDPNLIFNIFTNSQGMTSYKPCHTENFLFSATPGFDLYQWNIGSIHVESVNNKIVVPVTYADISANGNITVSAFNPIFLPENPATIYNYAASDSSNVYRMPITFYDFPDPTLNISITTDLIDVSKYSDTTSVVGQLETYHTTVQDYTFNIILSSAESQQSISYSDFRTVFTKAVKIGTENTDFIINENSYNDSLLYLSGNVHITIPGFDFCTIQKTITSNVIILSVFSGPNLELYSFKNILSAHETVELFNGSNTNFYLTPNTHFTSYIFDNGDNDQQTISASTSAIFTSYNTEGSKSPALTGFLSNGNIVTQTWDNLIIVKNNFDTFDPSITKEFYKVIEMPYSLEQIKVRPNDWQYASNINTSFEKMKTNLDFLSANCSVNNINFPKVNGGFLGTRFGNFKWQTAYTATNLGDDFFSSIKSAQIVENKLLVINNNRIEVYSFGLTPALLFYINKINDGEILETPIKAEYSADLKRIYILDAGKQIMYVCNFDITDKNSFKLTHYWGGLGAKAERTKFNNAVDFCLDDDCNLFVVDKDSEIIKTYNKNLNWIRNIQLDTFSASNKPISISFGSRLLAVTTEDGSIILIDIFGNIIQNIHVEGATNAILNKNSNGILYIIQTNKLFKYNINNTYITDITYNDEIINIGFDGAHCYLIFEKYIQKIVDFTQIDKIINNNESLSGLSWNAIFVDEKEFVTDYIFNDSFEKIYDNINQLNRRIDKKLYVENDAFGMPVNQYTASYTPSAISALTTGLATNEPVLYDTINRNIDALFNNLIELKNNINLVFLYPNNNSNIFWNWKYHYVNRIQKPSTSISPVTWKELTPSKLSVNPLLSGIISWCSLRDNNVARNHSEFCFNYEQTRDDSYIPMTWNDLKIPISSTCAFIRPYTWAELDIDCCRYPDFVFENCITVC
jgi:hypothetical protein